MLQANPDKQGISTIHNIPFEVTRLVIFQSKIVCQLWGLNFCFIIPSITSIVLQEMEKITT